MTLIEKQIPAANPQDVQRWLVKGMRHFNQSGFTHIRDLTSTAMQWNQSCHLADSGLLTLAVETYFGAYTAQEFDQAFRLAQQARKEQRHLLKVSGVKVFLDGALGSEGAWLSQPYQTGSGCGLQLLSDFELKSFMRRCFEADLAIAVHVIGDEATARAVKLYAELGVDGLHGEMHLEHVELARPETISLMSGKNITCHFQPCHWLSDKAWLKEKIGPLMAHIFPWRQMQTAEVAFTFGSDAPIERCSVAETLRALDDSAAAGVPKLLGDPLEYHSHPDVAWVPNTYTVFRDGLPEQVVFAGEHIL